MHTHPIARTNTRTHAHNHLDVETKAHAARDAHVHLHVVLPRAWIETEHAEISALNTNTEVQRAPCYQTQGNSWAYCASIHIFILV